MSDEWARKIYARLDWVLIWLFIIAMNTCHSCHKTADPAPPVVHEPAESR